MIKKIVAILLTFLLMIMTSTSVFATNDCTRLDVSLEEIIPLEVQISMAAQESALESYSKLISFFEKDQFGVPIYPDNYAGEYIDDNNKLVVQLTEEFKDTKVLKFLKNDSNIIINYVEYSYDELMACRDIANELYASKAKIVSDGVDIIQNKYKITIQEADISNISTIYSTYSNEDLPIVFEVGDCAVASTSLWGGDSISNADTGFRFTLGICGTYNGNNAILTCGHGNEFIEDNNRYPYINNLVNRIGQVVYQQANIYEMNYGVDSLGDFAIVNITSSDTMSNYVQPGAQITGTYSSVPVGTTVYKYGTVSGYSWGEVTDTSLRVLYDPGESILDILSNYYVGGLYRMEMTNDTGTAAVAEGDSGGPVWRKDGNANLLHGIVTAQSGDNIMYTTPIYYAQYQGFTPKTN